MNHPIKVSIIEDHQEFRDTIKFILENQEEVTLFNEFGNAELALRAMREKHNEDSADVILLDLNLPGMSGLEAIPSILKYSPKSKIIVLSQDQNEKTVLNAIHLGVSGYLFKSASIESIVTGIKEVSNGGGCLEPTLAKFVIKLLKTSMDTKTRDLVISKREQQVITLIADGHSQKEIASRLEISTHTVTDHLKSIYAKLNVQNAPQAVARAIRSGIL